MTRKEDAYHLGTVSKRNRARKYACMQGTLGRRVQKGLTEAPMMNSDGKIEVIKIRLGIESIEGFSGHSDRRQIISISLESRQSLRKSLCATAKKMQQYSKPH